MIETEAEAKAIVAAATAAAEQAIALARAQAQERATAEAERTRADSERIVSDAIEEAERQRTSLTADAARQIDAGITMDDATREAIVDAIVKAVTQAETCDGG
jgi:F0F1-type ATP synthase membrane subunit b/b'